VALLVLGVALVAGGLAVRNGKWARERRLRTLTEQELAYAVHDDPYDALTFLYYGSALLKSGEVSASEQAFQRATTLDPRLARAFDGLGSAQMRLGKIKNANDAFQTAVTIDPRDTAGYLGLSQTFFQAGSAQRAIDPLKKLVELEPKNAEGWYHLGALYGEAHQSDQAYAAIQKAVALDGTKAEYWRDLGKLSMHYARVPDAESQLRRSLHLEHNDPVTHYWLGQLYAQMGDTPQYYGQAEQELVAATMRDPTLEGAYFELGQLYERHRNYTLAISNYQRACSLDPADDRPLYRLGRCLVTTGSKSAGEEKMHGAQALAAAKKEIQDLQNRSLAEPQNAELHLRLARTWRKYSNEEDALKEYRSYRMLGPPDPAVEKEIDSYTRSMQSAQAHGGN
jgi:Flp pilus assembly protein TadD